MGPRGMIHQRGVCNEERLGHRPKLQNDPKYQNRVTELPWPCHSRKLPGQQCSSYELLKKFNSIFFWYSHNHEEHGFIVATKRKCKKAQVKYWNTNSPSWRRLVSFGGRLNQRDSQPNFSDSYRHRLCVERMMTMMLRLVPPERTWIGKNRSSPFRFFPFLFFLFVMFVFFSEFLCLCPSLSIVVERLRVKGCVLYGRLGNWGWGSFNEVPFLFLQVLEKLWSYVVCLEGGSRGLLGVFGDSFGGSVRRFLSSGKNLRMKKCGLCY